MTLGKLLSLSGSWLLLYKRWELDLITFHAPPSRGLSVCSCFDPSWRAGQLRGGDARGVSPGPHRLGPAR